MIAPSALRQSIVNAISPGMTLREGLAITASPIVPTAFGPCLLAMLSIASTISDKVASASRRSGIGVVPAWLSKPVIFAVVPQHALAGIDHADGLVLGLEDGALLNVKLDEAGEFLGDRPASRHGSRCCPMRRRP